MKRVYIDLWECHICENIRGKMNWPLNSRRSCSMEGSRTDAVPSTSLPSSSPHAPLARRNLELSHWGKVTSPGSGQRESKCKTPLISVRVRDPMSTTSQPHGTWLWYTKVPLSVGHMMARKEVPRKWQNDYYLGQLRIFHKQRQVCWHQAKKSKKYIRQKKEEQYKLAGCE